MRNEYKIMFGKPKRNISHARSKLRGKIGRSVKRNQIVRDDWICKASWHDYSLDDLHPLFVSLKQELYYMIRK